MVDKRDKIIFDPKPNLDIDTTIERLSAAGAKMQPHDDGGESPRGLWWFKREDATYQIGNKGKVTVFASDKDMPEACDFINDHAVDRNGKRPLFSSERGVSPGQEFLFEHGKELEKRVRLYQKFIRNLNLPDPVLLDRLKLLNDSVLIDTPPCSFGESVALLRRLNPSILVARP